MIATKTKPAGIDIMIQTLQSFLYSQLLTIWKLQASDYSSYGRAYRNQKEKGYVPEVYTGTGEYMDAFPDDTVKVSSFFGMGENQRYNGGLNSPVFLIFMAQIDQLKPGITWRADEEVRRDVENLLKTGRFGFQLTGVETGIANVFREYDIAAIKYRDIHPWHCFRLNLTINYPIANC